MLSGTTPVLLMDFQAADHSAGGPDTARAAATGFRRLAAAPVSRRSAVRRDAIDRRRSTAL
jgi:hypothetical protein